MIAESLFTVVICTRDRAPQLHRTLDALERQTDAAFPIVVVDQSDPADAALAGRAEESGRLSVVHDSGRGLSHARNLAWRALESEWIVFVDDDCLPDEDWAAQLREALVLNPQVDFVSGNVAEHNVPGGDYLAVTSFTVEKARLRSGRWTKPWLIGFGVCMAIRRSAIERLGGWDERLGAGSPIFGAAEDMDFNFRFLRSGGVAYATPSVRAVHDQWRTREQLAPLYGRYMLAWSAFAMKTLREGDVRGGLWLWVLGAIDAVRMLASAFRRRSRLRFRVALRKLAGLVVGTVKGLAYRW